MLRAARNAAYEHHLAERKHNLQVLAAKRKAAAAANAAAVARRRAQRKAAP